MLSFPVTCYLFLGGAGAGACLVAAVLGLLSPREFVEGPSAHLYGRLLVPSFLAAALLMLAGVLCLAVDLGRADRIMLLVQSPALTYIAVGAYALVLSLVLAALLAFVWNDAASRGSATRRALGLWGGRTHGIRVALEVAALVAAGVTMVYTGLLLHDVHAVPLWTTLWLPVLFALSSLSCGLAVVLGVAQFTGASQMFGSALAKLAGIDVVVVVLEAIAVACVVLSASAGAGFSGQTALAAQDSVARLLTGDFVVLFWGGFVVVGLAVPAVAETLVVFRWRHAERTGWAGRAGQADQVERAGWGRPGWRFSTSYVGRGGVSLALCAAPTLLASACVLAGGFALRLCVVGAGMHPVLSTMGVM